MKLPKQILLVEDDQDDQEFFTEALDQLIPTNKLSIACNGKEALEKLQNGMELPDIIFMDINMPVMNGIECLKALKENIRTQHISIVMLTSDVQKIEQVRRLGAKAFIEKSSNQKIFRKNLRSVFSGIVHEKEEAGTRWK